MNESRPLDGSLNGLRGIVVGSGILVAATLSGLPATSCYAMVTAYLLGGLGMGVTFAAAGTAYLLCAPRDSLPQSPAQHKWGRGVTIVICLAFTWVVFVGNFNVWRASNHCNRAPQVSTQLRTGTFLQVMPLWWLRPDPSGNAHRLAVFQPDN